MSPDWNYASIGQTPYSVHKFGFVATLHVKIVDK